MNSQDSSFDAIIKLTETISKLARPYIIVDVYPRRSVNMLYFRIRNVGYTPAFNIRTKINPPITFRQRSSSDLNIFSRAIAVIGPKEEISFFFDSAIGIFSSENRALQFDVNLEYFDTQEIQYKQTIHIDIELLKNLAVELPVFDKITGELEHIQKNLEKIARYTEHFLQEGMMKDFPEPKPQDGQPSEGKDSSET